jgi:hypothetical protein
MKDKMKKAFYTKPYTIKRQRPVPRKRIIFSRASLTIKEKKPLDIEQPTKPVEDVKYHCPTMIEVDGEEKKCEFKTDRWKTMKVHIIRAHPPIKNQSIEWTKSQKKHLIKNKELIEEACKANRVYEFPLPKMSELHVLGEDGRWKFKGNVNEIKEKKGNR